jgi:integral membrane protein
MFSTLIGRLRITGLVEGLSYLALLFIAMPLKYIWDMPEAVRLVGSIHGFLFILFIYFIFQAHIEKGWSRRELSLALLSSVIPFGTFYADNRLFKKYQ